MISNEAREQINKELLEMALANFTEFCRLMNFDETRAQICLLKSKGKSYGQIANALGKSRDHVIGVFKRNCGCLPPLSEKKKKKK